MRKLRRSSLAKRYEVEPLRLQKSLSARKLSQVILDFAQPLSNASDDDRFFKNAIACAVLCWNLSFLKEKEQQRQMRSIVNKLSKSGQLTRFEIRDCVQMLLERKRNFFADDRRMVINYEVVEEEDSRHLFVASMLVEN